MILMFMEIFTDLESKYFILRKYVFILISYYITVKGFRQGGFFGGSKSCFKRIL